MKKYEINNYGVYLVNGQIHQTILKRNSKMLELDNANDPELFRKGTMDDEGDIVWGDWEEFEAD